MRIGLFGGSFNPPHTGHIEAAKQFAAGAKLDLLYIMPAGIPPHKTLSGGASSADRFRMARLAFREDEIGCRTVCSALELARAGKSYTVDTVHELLRRHKTDTLYLYVGDDMLTTFTGWYHFEELFRTCILVAAARTEEMRSQIRSVCDDYAARFGCRYLLLDFDPVVISSTALRETLRDPDKNHKNSANIHLTGDVNRYIIDRKLYCDPLIGDSVASPEVLEEIRGYLPTVLDEKRLSHTWYVEKQALEMAVFCGYPTEELPDVSEAALLHDMTKNRPDAWHNAYLSQFRGVVDEVPNLYHAHSSAYAALERYGVTPRVFGAIYHHTTGHAGMTLLEKIICLADFIEESRPHEVCRRVRKVYYEKTNAASDEAGRKRALDETLLLSFRLTYEHLIEKHAAVDGELLTAIDSLEKELTI